MKILVFADTHGSLSALEKVKKLAKKEKVDLILCLGDITVFEENLDKLMKKIDDWGMPVLMIHGNHEEAGIMDYLSNKMKNIRFVHGQAIRFNDVLILAHGGGGFAHYDPKFEKLSEEWKDEIKKTDTVVMMVHQPPFKAIDTVLDEHTGSKSYAIFIKKIKPAFCFCGHLHEHFGEEATIKKTRIINSGPYGKVFEVS